LAIAFAAYVALGILALLTLEDQRFRFATLAILAMLAVKTWVRRKDFLHSGDESESE
jgi:membrane protein implicated in regulation of membrane protease activity